jgi:serine protease Do
MALYRRAVRHFIQELARMSIVRSHRWGILVMATLMAASVGLVSMTPRPAQAQGAAAARGLPDFSDLVEQVGPSVVNIRTLERARAAGPQGSGVDEEMQEFFRRFFGQPMPNIPRQGPRPNRPQEDERPRGVGSGFILTGDGYIMTNAHVVDGADEVVVTLTDKREFRARIVGTDRRTDVAVVKIEASGLPAVRIGDVTRLRVGEWVMAIGSPFGLDNTVTAGIVSAKQRDTGDYLPFIQTDVAINPGNSGGPLINLRGEVVGINSQIYSRSGGFMGISFAIPIDEASRVAEQLRTTGRVTRGRIGVQIDQVTKDVAESIGLGKPAGALVRSVEAGSPAEKAGIEAGDIITRFDGRAIEKSTDLPRLVGNTRPGTRSTLSVFRRGAVRDVGVVIGEVEPERAARRASDREERPSRPSIAGAPLGLTVSEVPDGLSRDLKIKGGVRVDAASEAAARAGLREGDVIVAIANTEVSSVKEFETVVSRIDRSKPVNVLFRRGEWAQYAVIRPGR